MCFVLQPGVQLIIILCFRFQPSIELIIILCFRLQPSVELIIILCVSGYNLAYNWSLFCVSGYNPVWNEVVGFKVHVPELAFLSFIVYDADQPLAQYTLPFQSIMQGMFKVPISNNHYSVCVR